MKERTGLGPAFHPESDSTQAPVPPLSAPGHGWGNDRQYAHTDGWDIYTEPQSILIYLHPLTRPMLGDVQP